MNIKLIITLSILVYTVFSIGFIENMFICQNKIDLKNKKIFNFMLFDYWVFVLLFFPGFLIYRVLILDFNIQLSNKKMRYSVIIKFLLSISLISLGITLFVLLWGELTFLWRFASISWLFFYFLLGYFGYPSFNNEHNNSSLIGNYLITKLSLDGSLLFFLPWYIVRSIVDVFGIKKI